MLLTLPRNRFVDFRVPQIIDLTNNSLTIEYFKKNGFIVVPNFFKDELIQEILNEIQDVEIKPNFLQKILKRFVRQHEIGKSTFYLKLLNVDEMRGLAETILGDVDKLNTFRGAYISLPPQNVVQKHLNLRKVLYPHIDRGYQYLNASVSLNDVEESNGSFTVYPGSHIEMYRLHRNQFSWNPVEYYNKLSKEVCKKIHPLELVIPKGSLILWHGRLLHSVGQHSRGKKRYMLHFDFSKQGSEGIGNLNETFKDTKCHVNDNSIRDNMWEDWNI